MFSVYPKVKVREQEEEDDLLSVYDHRTGPWQSWEAFQFLPMHDRGYEGHLSLSVVRILKSCISSLGTRMIPSSKEVKSSNKKAAMEDSKPNARANSMTRRRAVLSSPSNDGMIGNRKKVKPELLSGSKNNNSCQDRYLQTLCKSEKAADSKTVLEAKREATIANLRERTHLRKGKTDSI